MARALTNVAWTAVPPWPTESLPPRPFALVDVLATGMTIGGAAASGHRFSDSQSRKMLKSQTASAIWPFFPHQKFWS